ncbi:autophagy protein 13 [Exophiala xenobiotica]|uniref:Autophagy-related protein 13 n=1 Tax=Lithohypha guttulata TaxID=1690604 RepID=A0ABR0KGT5_9EURO|nr:autophagy protein 13 [Lithohypha guttulata]KAK5310793.1 autophagy protein 13 [Exophiala xenobiotica]
MHQHPRPPPSTASPATSEPTNPYRSNNPRDRDRTPSSQASGSSEDFVTARQEPDTAASMQRLNQVVQNFHTKAALIILHSRADLSPAYSSKTNEKRVNKWFNIELDETDDYLDDIKRWKRIDVRTERPPPLIIEVYLTTDTLPQGQRLVILDDDQKRWDVYNALEPRQSHSGRTTSTRPEKSREILLERWSIELGESSQPIPADLAAILPHVYKKSIVLFRALFTYCNFLPAWKLIRKLGKSRSTMGMKVGFRIVDGDRLDSIARADNLNTALYESRSPTTTDYSFGSTDSPAGPFAVHVKYRSNSDFRVDDSEELLSSRFIGADDDIFKPSLRERVGSLPTDQRRYLMERPELGQAYGSLSTFHQAGINTGTSPISALRAQKDLGSDSPSPQRPLPQQAQPTRPAASRSSTSTRRSSFSLNPFKAPTLAASPLGSSPLGASPRVSARAVPTLDSLQEEVTQATPENRTASARKPSSIENVTAVSTSSSPRPAPVQRFQSSFSHRRNRLSVDRTANKTDEDQTSSGKASAASSGQPGSGLMTEAAREGSSGSMQADDENISDFLKMLDQKKDLLKPASSSALESSAKRTAAALNKFHKMRDSNAALSESMSSSLVVPKPSASPGRQLPAQAAISTSSSPGGKPVSPHTPHTPFAPSRLSAAYSHDDAVKEALRNDGAASPDEQEANPVQVEVDPSGIPIPNSPSAFKLGYRRSSSAQRRPPSSDDDIGDLYGMRSASMGADVRQQPSLTNDSRPLDLPSSKKEAEAKNRMAAQDVSDSSSNRSSLPYRSRFARGGAAARGGSHASPIQNSSSSIGATGASVEKTGDSGSVSGSWGRGGRTQGSTRPEGKTGEDDDDFPFLMDASAKM